MIEWLGEHRAQKTGEEAKKENIARPVRNEEGEASVLSPLVALLPPPPSPFVHLTRRVRAKKKEEGKKRRDEEANEHSFAFLPFSIKFCFFFTGGGALALSHPPRGCGLRCEKRGGVARKGRRRN